MEIINPDREFYVIDITSRKIIHKLINLYLIFTFNSSFEVKRVYECLVGIRKTCYNYGWVYCDLINQNNFYLYFENRLLSKLFQDIYPELYLEIVPGQGLDFENITYGCGKSVLWKCKIYDHQPYFTTFNSRSNKKSGCRQCFVDSIRVLDKNEKENHIKNFYSHTNEIDVGQKTEIYVCDLLLWTKCFKNVERCGFTGEKCDIKITLLNDVQVQIQVKTLVKDDRDDIFYINKCKYENNMLIVMINKDRTRFALDFWKNIGEKKLTLSFKSGQTKNENIMFRDINSFALKLIQLVPLSSIYKLEVSIDQLKEINMMIRLENFCSIRGYSFRRNETNADTIDGFINNYSFQAKFISFCNSERSNFYLIGLHKNCGVLNGVRVTIPYHIDDDFKFLIIEVSGINCKEENERVKYLGKFCIIPKQILIDREVLASNLHIGKKSINVCAPDYNKNHWSKQYWC